MNRSSRKVTPPLPALLRIIAFFLICLMPVLALMTQVRLLRIKELANHFALKSWAHSALERSLATRTAVWLKSNVEYRVFHQVDTPLVISGREDWLFLKAEFGDGNCLRATEYRALLAQADVMTDMAEAAGLDLIFSVSPDKSWIYSEKLHPRYHRYWKCKKESSAKWRELARFQAPRLIDHGVPLLAAKSKQGGPKLYFHTDTHWTPYAAALSFRQLLATIIPGAPIDAATLRPIGTFGHESDLGNSLLLLKEQEPVDKFDDEIGNVVRDKSKTIFIHDSFYGYFLKDQIAQVFPNGQDYTYRDKVAYTAAILTADRLVINSVERLFFERLRSGDLSPSSALARAILARNTRAAHACVNSNTIGAQHFFRPFHSATSGERAGGEAIKIRIPNIRPTSYPCLTLKLNGGIIGPLKIFFPEKGKGYDVFKPGRVAEYQPTDTGRVAMVLPDYLQGRAIKIVPPRQARIIWVEFGQRPALDQ